MGKRRPVTVGTREFRTAGEAIKFVQDMVARYPDEEWLSEQDAAFVSDLLELHPRADEKIGVGGIQGFLASTNPEHPNTRTIYGVRSDGSRFDFSWRKCINGEEREDIHRKALRRAIVEQTIAFKKEQFSTGQPVSCSITGQSLEWNTCHVDHVAPYTLDRLIDDWLASENIVIEDVAISPSRDLQYNRNMTDAKQRQSWEQYHYMHKRLRLLGPEGHRSLPKYRHKKETGVISLKQRDCIVLCSKPSSFTSHAGEGVPLRLQAAMSALPKRTTG